MKDARASWKLWAAWGWLWHALWWKRSAAWSRCGLVCYSLMHCRLCFPCRVLLHSEHVAQVENEPGTSWWPLTLRRRTFSRSRNSFSFSLSFSLSLPFSFCCSLSRILPWKQRNQEKCRYLGIFSKKTEINSQKCRCVYLNIYNKYTQYTLCKQKTSITISSLKEHSYILIHIFIYIYIKHICFSECNFCWILM